MPQASCLDLGPTAALESSTPGDVPIPRAECGHVLAAVFRVFKLPACRCRVHRPSTALTSMQASGHEEGVCVWEGVWGR